MLLFFYKAVFVLQRRILIRRLHFRIFNISLNRYNWRVSSKHHTLACCNSVKQRLERFSFLKTGSDWCPITSNDWPLFLGYYTVKILVEIPLSYIIKIRIYLAPWSCGPCKIARSKITWFTKNWFNCHIATSLFQRIRLQI